jgi:serine/threonine protein kinase
MGAGGTVGVEADWWALACTIIHMLTGAAPMSNMNMVQVLDAVVAV